MPVTGTPPAGVTFVHCGANRGFAAGANVGLALLRRVHEVKTFWILNPDCEVAPGAAQAYADAGQLPGAGLIGGRTLYLDPPHLVQSDGGRVNWWTGVCSNVNQGKCADRAALPDPETLDFVSGANFAATRAFLDHAGPLPADYFLYYEEVDWAQRRGSLGLSSCPQALVFHAAGTAIGSGTLKRAPSALSNYFNYRNRMRFIRRRRPLALPVAWAFAMLKVTQHLVRREWDAGLAALRGANGLPPPRAARARLAPKAHGLAFGLKEG